MSFQSFGIKRGDTYHMFYNLNRIGEQSPTYIFSQLHLLIHGTGGVISNKKTKETSGNINVEKNIKILQLGIYL